MEILNRIRQWLRRQMAGRNGWDSLNQALLMLYLALWVLGGIVGAVLGSGLFSGLFTLLMQAALLVLLFRLLSRNVAKRQSENLWWLNSPLLVSLRRMDGGIIDFFSRLRDREHRYFKCKHCGARCRVPAGKGRIMIICPKCGREWQKKT